MATEEVDFGSSFGKGLEKKNLEKILRGNNDYTIYIGGVVKNGKV